MREARGQLVKRVVESTTTTIPTDRSPKLAVAFWQLLTFQSIQRTKEQSCNRNMQSQGPFLQGLQPLQLQAILEDC